MPANSTTNLSGHLSFSPKYRRSANIELDAEQADELPAFSFAPTSIKLLEEILDSTDGRGQDAAWSIIGPYGSGKSLFGVFVAHLARKETTDWLAETLTSLEVAEPKLAERIVRLRDQNELDYEVLALSGSPMSLNVALLSALDKTCRSDEENAWVSKSFEGKVARELEAAAEGIEDARSTAELFAQAAQLAQAAGKKGLLVLVDEFGQFLEYASSRGASSNLLVAQYLAEQAARSRNSGLRLLTFLHQSVLHYAQGMSEGQSLEWEKVQGRFKEFAFGEVAEAQYSVIRGAVQVSNVSATIKRKLKSWRGRVLQEVEDLPHFNSDSARGSVRTQGTS